MEDRTKKAIKIGKKVFIVVIVLLIVVSVGLCVYKKKNDNQNKAKNAQGNQIMQEDGDQEYKLGENEYRIDVQEKDGNKIITNGKVGISLTIPGDWKPETVYDVNNELKLKVSQVGPEQPKGPGEIVDGIMLEVYKYENNSGLDLNKWMQDNDIKDYKQINFQEMKAFKKDSKVDGQLDENLNYIPIEDSLYQAIFVSQKNAIYEIGCSSFGKYYREYGIQCFDIANANLKL